MWMLLAAQLTVVSSGTPLAPAEAVAVLAQASPDRNLTRAHFVRSELPEGLLPIPTRSTYRPGDGPFGPFPRPTLPPLRGWSQISYPLPHPVFDVRIIGRKVK